MSLRCFKRGGLWQSSLALTFAAEQHVAQFRGAFCCAWRQFRRLLNLGLCCAQSPPQRQLKMTVRSVVPLSVQADAG